MTYKDEVTRKQKRKESQRRCRIKSRDAINEWQRAYKAKNRKVLNERRREAKAAKRVSFMADKSCAECGINEGLISHHKNPKEKECHNFWEWSEEKRKIELKKCIVLCEECHKKIHFPNAGNHGTHRMYKVKKCRCNECRAFMSAYKKQERILEKAVF